MRHGVKKVIFISSGGAVYGAASEYPTSEAYQPIPLSPYAVSKYCSEHYLAYYRHQHGLDYTTLRYSNIYGPRQIPHGEAGVVAIFMDNLLNGRPSTLFHFPDDDAGMIRDYCYVGDVVKANLKVLEKGNGDFFNIGTEVETKTADLYQCIYDAFDEIGQSPAEDLAVLIKSPARAGDLAKSCLTASKASHLLGWTPQTDILEGIKKTLEWRISQQA